MERVNISSLPLEVLEGFRKKDNSTIGNFLKKPALPQSPYGQPQSLPVERKPESQKKHINRDGRGGD